jgi:hypothetical protein
MQSKNIPANLLYNRKELMIIFCQAMDLLFTVRIILKNLFGMLCYLILIAVNKQKDIELGKAGSIINFSVLYF